MKIRFKSRPTRARYASTGDDNIFSEVYEVEKPRAIVPRDLTRATADVLHPVAFRAQSVDVINSDTPSHLRGLAAICVTGRVVTPNGPQMIGDLKVGDLVLTRDNGFRPILMTLNVTHGAAAPCLIEIAQGALGEGRPEGALRMSGRQRVLLSGPKVQAQFGTSEVLVRAGDLLHLEGVRQITEVVNMTGLLFENHEVLRVNESWFDSMQPDRECRAHLSADQETALMTAVPNLKDLPIERSFPAARQVLNSAFARQFRIS